MFKEAPRYISRSNELSLIWENFGSAGVLITNINASMVLLGNHREDPKRWSNFAGHRKRGESPFETATRETREESGLKIDPKRLGKPLIVIDQKKIGIIFPVKIPQNTQIILPKNGEILTTSWFTSDRVAETIIDQIDVDWAYNNTWGKAYTLNALTSWMQNRENFMQEFGGVIEVESHPAFI